MPAFVRDEREERLWIRAKTAAQSQGKKPADGSGYWKLVNEIFHRMKGGVGGGDRAERQARMAKADTYMPLAVAVPDKRKWAQRERDDEGKDEIVHLLIDDEGNPISKQAFDAILKSRGHGGLSAGGFGPAASLSPSVLRFPGQAGHLRTNARATQTGPAVFATVGPLIAREIRLADNEIALRKAVMAALESRGVVDFRAQKLIMAKAVATWRRRNSGPHKLTPSIYKAHQANTVTTAQGPPTQKTGPKLSAGRPKVPKLGSKPSLPTPTLPGSKIPQQGRGDPSKPASRRALPPGSVRIHFSRSRNGYVRALKMGDGSWKIISKIHGDHVTDSHKKESPKLPSHQEHKDSHPPGKAPVHDAGGNPVDASGKRKPPMGR